MRIRGGNAIEQGCSDVTYFRLKFPKQEIALFPGETLVGRSPACAVTIEDPLVSREHALLRVTETEAIFEDLASRNGSRINGVIVYGPTALQNGDVLSIGKHEVLFLATLHPPANGRPTGALRNCSSCRLPYAEEAGACPHCESAEYIEEPPVTEHLTEPAWALDMLNEMLLRVIALGRLEHAHRVIRRAVAHIDEQIEVGARIERKQLDLLVETLEHALSLSETASFSRWVSSVYERLGWSRNADGVPER